MLYWDILGKYMVSKAVRIPHLQGFYCGDAFLEDIAIDDAILYLQHLHKAHV